MRKDKDAGEFGLLERTSRTDRGSLGEHGGLDRGNNVERALAGDLWQAGGRSVSGTGQNEARKTRTHVADLLALREEAGSVSSGA